MTTIRAARPDDLEAIRRFGADYIPDHYRPLIGDAAAQAQVDRWWTTDRITAAIERGQMTVAEEGGELIGVTEIGVFEGTFVVWKLYLHPEHRGKGLGRQLLRHVIERLPAGAGSLQVEHVAANRRAGDFYEREGFAYLRTEPHPTNPAMNVVWRELKLDRG